MSGQRISRALLAAVALLAIAALVAFHAADGPIDWDDAYISFRCAENFASGAGPVFNPGERIYGTTTLSWVVWLGALHAATGIAIPALAQATSMVLLVANLLLVVALAWLATRRAWPAVAAGALALVASDFLLTAATGMEGMFFACFVLLAFAAHATQRDLAAGALAGLAAATRLDGLATIAAIGLAAAVSSAWNGRGLAERTRQALGALARPLAGFAIVVVPFAVACTLYFGSPLPHTLLAKREHVMVAGRWWMLEHFVRGPAWPVAAALAVWGSILVARAAGVRHRAVAIERAVFARTVGVWAAWLAIFVAAWTVVRIDRYAWYLAAAAPVCALLVATAADRVGRVWLGHWPQTVTTLAVLLVPLSKWTKWTARDVERFGRYAETHELPRLRIARAIAAASDAPSEVLGAGAIGIVGYHLPATKVVDFAGLVTPLGDRHPDRTSMMVGYDLPPDLEASFRAVHRVVPLQPGPDCVVLVRRDGRSTWNGSRLEVPVPMDVELGRVRVLGLDPLGTSASSGGRVLVEIKLCFPDAPPDGSGLVATLLRSGEVLARVEVTGLVGGRRPFRDVGAGEVVLETLVLPVPEGTGPGAAAVHLGLLDGGGPQQRICDVTIAAPQ
jgi:hypothetical protein